MPLPAGSRLAHYEIVAPLGAGGMGEVYRARDTRLNRQVAIKTLPEAFALDPDRLARFQREAQLLAALSHPNIAAIHGLEESPAGAALVLELVEGDTLAERLQRAGSGLPLDDALQIARQICDALEAAHDTGIVHRDLKPANIKITPAGVVKVLDFGLAKLVTPAAPAAGVDVSSSPTMVTAMSMPGMLLGTAAYMSPEQAKGHDADRRSDIWAFGCVLYEMLTGRAPFAGGSVSEIISEVLKSEPDWNRLPADTPAGVRRVMRRCLTKDPRRRLQHVGDARLELDEAPDAPGDSGRAASRALWRWKPAVAALAMVAAAVALAGYAMRGAPAPDRAVKRLHIQAPQGLDDIHDLALSPSGRQLALVGSTESGFAIFIRSLESLESRRVVDIEQRQQVFWSPNGQSLGFFDGGQLKVVNVVTGETRIVCEAPEALGGSWGADDTIIFTPRATGGVHRVSAQGGPVIAITSPDPQREESHRWPRFLPDGRRFIFMGWTARETNSNTRFTVQMADLDSSSPILLTRSSSAAVYDPAGYLLFALNAPLRLAALSFDAAAGTVSGSPVTVAEDLDYNWITGAIPVATGDDGTLLYLNNQHEKSTLTWMARDGRELETVGEAGVYYDPALSADGTSLLVERSDPTLFSGDVWRIEIGSGTFSRLTHEPSFESSAVWSPDGRRVVYSSDRDGLSHLYVRDADGSNEPVKLFGEAGALAYASDWSPDGQHLLFMSINQERNNDLWVLSMADGGTARPLLQSAYPEEGGTFSPDGKWIAYTSGESGQSQVYVRSWPAFTGVRQVSTRGGRQPQWRGDGRELFYSTRDGSIMGAPVASGADRLQAGPPVMLFNPDLEVTGLRNRFVVTADGQRFLVLKPTTNRRAAPVTVLVNWPAALRLRP